MKESVINTEKVLILENIRSIHNVGAIFRTADAIGMDKIYLIGYTPSPIDRFGRVRQDLHKSALGAEENIEWEHIDSVNASQLIISLKEKGFITISIEQDENSTDYKKISEMVLNKNCVIVVGNEVDGVSSESLNVSDFIAEIPMNGSKESLNVSVATGVALYGILDK
jgi:tRNA G18 (ribose-2'-O)-methylase SpoU